MAFRFVILMATAAVGCVFAKQMPGGPSVECRQEIQQNLASKDKQMAAQECEEEKGFREEAVAKLQANDQSGAADAVSQSFEQCAGISDKCSKQLAPHVVQKMRFAGLGVSQECAAEMQRVQSDESRVNEIAECEQKEKLAENMLDKLNQGKLEGAVSVAENGLDKCIGFETEGCSTQFAPVIVNQLVQQAMQQQQQEPPMMPILASTQSSTAKSEPSAETSLIALSVEAAHSQKKRLFLQSAKRAQKGPWVSRLLLDLAGQ